MDLRKEAEKRVKEYEKKEEKYEINKKSFRTSLYSNNNKKKPLKDSLATEDHPNITPSIAHLKEIDYKLNGARARAASGDFIVPRWVPDEEVNHCYLCNSEFDWVNRKHHCRSCGNVCCEACTIHRSLLPHEYGYRDPCRVCDKCYKELEPFQRYLSNNIANHQRVNNIDVVSTNCNVRRYFNMPFSSTLGSEIRKAAYSTHNLFALEWIKDKAIPLRLLSEAKGLAFLTVVKGGFIFAPRIGTGLVISRLPESQGGGWSAPTAIATVGLSWGAVIGLDFTDYVIILNTVEAVHAFSGSGQITIGAGLEVALGPVGRSGSADLHISDTGLAPAYSYSHSRGLFAGLSLDGTLILARHEVNHRFYGRPVSPAELLYGGVKPPRAAAPLYDALVDALSSLPDVQHLRPFDDIDNNETTRSKTSDGSNIFKNIKNPKSEPDDNIIDENSNLRHSIDYSKLYQSKSVSQTETSRVRSMPVRLPSDNDKVNIYGDDNGSYSTFIGQRSVNISKTSNQSTNPFQSAVDRELESTTTFNNISV